MKFNQLASHIAKIEGKKREVTIGNIREMVAIICEVLYAEKDFPAEITTYKEMMRIGQRRLARKKSKK